MTAKLSVHDALIYVMVTMSAVDKLMSDNELRKIGNIVVQLPAFANAVRVKICIAPTLPVQAMPPPGRSAAGGSPAASARGPDSSDFAETIRSAKYLP